MIEAIVKSVVNTQVFLHTNQTLQAFWLGYKTFVIENGKAKHTCRISLGQKVKVLKGVIIDCHEETKATHTVKTIFGHTTHLEYVEVENLFNNQIEKIKV